MQVLSKQRHYHCVKDKPFSNCVLKIQNHSCSAMPSGQLRFFMNNKMEMKRTGQSRLEETLQLNYDRELCPNCLNTSCIK
jgi:hypothetical protein